MKQLKETESTRKRGNKDRAPATAGNIWLLPVMAALLVILNALLLYGIFFSARGIQAYQKQQQQVASLNDTRAKLTRDNQRMLNKIRLLKNDPQAQERLIKRELGWVHEDEVIIEFANPNPGELEPGK